MKSTDFGEPDVRDVRLPLGDAVRIRQNFIGEKERLPGGRPVIHSPFYGVGPEHMAAAITLLGSWMEPVLYEPLEQIIDNIA
ncbi:hypothetical protein ACH5A2_04730 [Streptomyces collinus]|uniref:hypothetical protein n=1 Tax=Streptomyces collinus TaxID=42684 RepID=UPI0037B63690